MPYLFQYPLSALFYIALAVFVIVASSAAARKNSPWIVLFIIMVLSLVSGLRGYSVGTDTSAYVNYYLTQQSTYFEQGYALLVHVLMLSGSIQVTLTGIAFLTYSLLIWRMWGFRKDFNFPVSMASFMSLVFFASWNVQRFYIAAAILFFALPYVFNGRTIRYLLFCVLAFLFHRTAICGVALIPLRLLWISELEASRKSRLIIFSISSIMAAAGIVVYFWSSGAFDRYYTTYESSESGPVGGSWYVFFIIVVLAANYVLVSRKRGVSEPRVVVATVLLTGIYVLTTIITYSVPGIGRLPQFLTSVACLALSWLWDYQVEEQPLIRLLIFIYIAYVFLGLIGTNGHSIMPYSIWLK